MRTYFNILLLLFMTGTVVGQQKVELYKKELPNAKEGGDLGTNAPEFYVFKPEKVTSDIAFLVIPGGGYGQVAIRHEGYDVATKLNELGYPAFVLKYRLPKSDQQVDKRIAPIQDAQTALAYIHKNAKRLGLGKVKYVAVIGFSAGGHLASTLSTHFDFDYIRGAKTKISHNLRPDFSILCYPVISMDDAVTHQGSKKNLIGPALTAEDVARFSNELNINDRTPPTFLMHARDDQAVPIANSTLYIDQLKHHQIPYEFFTYDTGGHGFGLVNKTDPRSWFDAMIDWVEKIKK